MCFILKKSFQLINNLYLNFDVEVESALIIKDLKDVETNLVVVEFFSIFIGINLLSYTIEDKPNIVSPTKNE